jgi:hypothetical protein
MTTVTVSSLGIERVQKFDNTERGCVGRSSRSIFAMTLAGPLRDECGTRRNLLGFAALRRTSDLRFLVDLAGRCVNHLPLLLELQNQSAA